MKKTLKYYNSLFYKMEIIQDTEEGGYIVRFPELPGCMSSGKNVQTAINNANEAKTLWLKAALKDNIEIFEPLDESEYSGQFKLRLPKSLHKSLAERSKAEGISMNQYCVYLLSRHDV